MTADSAGGMKPLDPGHQQVELFFVPTSLVRQALVDMQSHWAFGFSWVKSCDYLKDDNVFAVLVVMTASYPFMVNRWREKWEKAQEPTMPPRQEGEK